MSIDSRPLQPINPAMITLARESRGMTQTELSGKLSISQALLSKWEAGLSEPAPEMYGRLAAALDYPADFFCLTDTVYGPGLSEFFHRRRQDTPLKAISRIHAQINVMRMHIARLLKAVDLPASKIKPLDIDEFKGQPAEVARAVRQDWQLPEGPIQNVIRTIEDAGGIVIRYNFGTRQIDAISRWIPGLPPLFFINTGLTTDRERMSLCHELGHIVMHHSPTQTMEVEANQFAAEFLMPARDIKPHLDGLNLARLAAIKPYWKVSMGAALYRAAELKRISERTYRHLWMKMSALGYKRREPPELDLPPEQPGLLQEVFDLYSQQFGYGLKDFQKLLVANETDLMEAYHLHNSVSDMRHRLRVVRQESVG